MITKFKELKVSQKFIFNNHLYYKGKDNKVYDFDTNRLVPFTWNPSQKIWLIKE